MLNKLISESEIQETSSTNPASSQQYNWNEFRSPYFSEIHIEIHFYFNKDMELLEMQADKKSSDTKSSFGKYNQLCIIIFGYKKS